MATVTVTQTLPTETTAAPVAITFTDGLSQPVSLNGSDLSVLVPSSASAGSSWLLRYLARPSSDLSQIVARLDQLGEEALTPLFGSSPVEPFLTFKNLWQQGRTLPERLTGILLALIYQTQSLQNTGRLS